MLLKQSATQREDNNSALAQFTANVRRQRTKRSETLELRFFMNRMFAAEFAVLAHRELLRVRFLVFAGVIVATCALFTSEVNIFTHGLTLLC